MKLRHLAAALAAACTLSLSACGGGGASSSAANDSPASAAPTVASSVNGVVATGRPLAGATVTAYGSDGNACGSAQTAADGSYAMNTQCVAGPVTFAVTSGPAGLPPLAAIALPNTSAGAVSGTVNLTPLSTLALYDFVATQDIVPTAQAEPSFAYILAAVPTIVQAGQLTGKSMQTILAQMQSAARAVVQAIAQQLQAVGIDPASFDPVTTPFAANGTGVDALFDQNPASAPAANAYQLGNLISLQLPAQAGASPVYGGSAAAALAGSGGALSGGGISMPTPSASGGAPAAANGSYQLSVTGFTGALAGSSCSLSGSGGSCTLSGRSYAMNVSIRDNGFGYSIINLHPVSAPNFLIVGVLPSAGGTGQGAWADPLGEIIAGGGSGNVVVQYTPN